MAYEAVLARFRGVKPHPSRDGVWWFFCPIHKGGEERYRSGAAWIGRRGQLMVGCWACRAFWKEIIQAVGLMARDLFPDFEERQMRPVPTQEVKRRVVERYDYQDETGNVLYRVLRYEPKGFSQHRPEGEGWVAGLADVRRVLYRLPELLSRTSEAVIVVEGERKALALAKWGLLSTTMAGGTGMGWRDDYSKALAGRKVLVIPDWDRPGLEHAYTVCGSLMAHEADSVRLVCLPGLGEVRPWGGLDVLDWIAQGNDLEQLRRAAVEAVEWRPRG